MATIMEQLGLLEFFLPLFTFLLIFVVCYAVLIKTSILGPNKWMAGLAAFAISLLFLFTPELMDVVKMTTPWFVLLVIFGLLIFSMFMFLGVKSDAMAGVLEQPSVHWTILILMIKGLRRRTVF